MGITEPPLKLIQSFLNNRLQRVVLNGQNSSRAPVFAGVLQGSVLGPLFLLIYIYYLVKDFLSTTKLFAESESQMNMDLEKISLWAYQSKMSFNPEISKQTKEVIFSKKIVNASHPILYFNRTPVIGCLYQKPLGAYLNKKLSFHQHIKEIITKASKGIRNIKRLE